MYIVLLGPPGSGKGTQAARIAAYCRIPAVSTGAIFRDALARGTALGQAVSAVRMDRGEYVPDDVVLAAVDERLALPDCANGCIFDGFPRTVEQAHGLDAVLVARHASLDMVLELIVPEAVLIDRFTGRRVCPRDASTYHVRYQPPKVDGRCDLCGSPLIIRADDAEDVVERRLALYHEATMPLAKNYRNRVQYRAIEADRSADAIFEAVKVALGACMPQTAAAPPSQACSAGQ
ncbi:MAG: adenylate kinase [Armatimonadetes bacterium]|nr:adenylate kinase [Armatimonadota bacterium]MDE2206863.1 adenylate kinase [Armatimonadota bacterium]